MGASPNTFTVSVCVTPDGYFFVPDTVHELAANTSFYHLQAVLLALATKASPPLSTMSAMKASLRTLLKSWSNASK